MGQRKLKFLKNAMIVFYLFHFFHILEIMALDREQEGVETGLHEKIILLKADF